MLCDLNNLKPFAPTQADMVERGDKITIPVGTDVTRPGKGRRVRVTAPNKRPIRVTVRWAGFGDVSWGSQRATEGTCDANDVIVTEWQHGEPTVDFGYLRDILGSGKTRNVAWCVNGTADRPVLGEGLSFIGRVEDYHSARMTLPVAEELYNRIVQWQRDAEAEHAREVAAFGPLGAFVRRVLSN